MTAGDALTKLLQYYDVRGEQQWGYKTNTETVVRTKVRTKVRTGGQARVARPDEIRAMMRAAIDSHPEIAHRALAMELGLDYDKIQANMERDSTSTQTEAGPSARDLPGVPSQGRKRRRVDAAEAAEPSQTANEPAASEPAARRIKIET